MNTRKMLLEMEEGKKYLFVFTAPFDLTNSEAERTILAIENIKAELKNKGIDVSSILLTGGIELKVVSKKMKKNAK